MKIIIGNTMNSRKYDGVVFRGEYSRQLFADLTNVSCAPDVVFNYNVEALKQEKKQVLMSVISMEGRNDKFAISAYGSDYREFMIKLSKAYIEEGYEVKYISFCQMQQDEEAILADTGSTYGRRKGPHRLLLLQRRQSGNMYRSI